jgi:hypothetical protein
VLVKVGIDRSGQDDMEQEIGPFGAQGAQIAQQSVLGGRIRGRQWHWYNACHGCGHDQVWSTMTMLTFGGPELMGKEEWDQNHGSQGIDPPHGLGRGGRRFQSRRQVSDTGIVHERVQSRCCTRQDGRDGLHGAHQIVGTRHV